MYPLRKAEFLKHIQGDTFMLPITIDYNRNDGHFHAFLISMFEEVALNFALWPF
jgi:hypothetical protein